MSVPDNSVASAEAATTRRSLLAKASIVVMFAGLAAAYGNFARMAARFLYPAGEAPRQWLFVARVADMALGDSRSYRAPSGEPISITRQAEDGSVDDFIALSSTCPHLGCQVHWEAQNRRYFCPCHNGAFDPNGVATQGPPAEAGQSLPRFPLDVRSGLLFIEVPAERLARATGPQASGDCSRKRGGAA